MHFIDAHNHSLPGIDDGAKNLEMALQMLTVAANNGSREVILTPHHLNGAFENQAQKVRQHAAELQQAAQDHDIDIQLHIGSEVHLTAETAAQILSGDALSFCDLGKAALIELPKHNIPVGTEKVLSELVYNGITPIIAHPERNTSLRNDNEPLIDWLSWGCKTQVTAMSCTGKFGSELQNATLKLISDGLVHLIASDTHRPTGRSPNLSEAAVLIEQFFDNNTCQTLFYENPRRLTCGEPLLSLNPVRQQTSTPKKRKWLSFLSNKN